MWGISKSFIANDKVVIDKVITEFSDKYFDEKDQTYNRIGFIENEDFETRWDNVKKYRQTFKINQVLSPDVCLRSFMIEGLIPIKKIEIKKIPLNTQWIFLTGMNGTGKSSILKALTAGLLENFDHTDKILNSNEFKVKYQLQVNDEFLPEKEITATTKMKLDASLLSIGFASYGASRLTIHAELDPQDKEMMKKTSLSYSMFHTDGDLLNIKEQFLGMMLQSRKGGTETSKIAEDRINQIVELLPELIPSLINIKLPEKTIEGVWEETLFTEEDENEEALPPVEFEVLASGVRSLVAMFGDMLLRLFAQQKDISDPSELKGIVIIDEIDIHLHPVLQKRLVSLLTGVLPKVQFIVSTHSPIPLLGAPKNTVVYTVKRNSKKGVYVDQLKGIDFSNMLPNTMLTSPIFGMDEVKPESNKNIKKIMVDNHFADVDFFKLVEKKIDELSKELDE